MKPLTLKQQIILYARQQGYTTHSDITQALVRQGFRGSSFTGDLVAVALMELFRDGWIMILDHNEKNAIEPTPKAFNVTLSETFE